MLKKGRSFFSLVLLSGTSVLIFGNPSFSQSPDMQGVCFTDQGRQNGKCACLDEAGTFDPGRRYGLDNARLCATLNDHERAELTREPEITGSITPPDGVIDPEPPGVVDQPRVQQDNGIGNGIDAAPGKSDVTNGDVADGADSGGPNPDGSFTDGTAANGRPAGETNNPNADSTNTAAADRGKSESAPGHNN
jgi:hypothetical protein